MAQEPPSTPSDEDDSKSRPRTDTQDNRGAEIGMTDGEGSTFEPEEDPEGDR